MKFKITNEIFEKFPGLNIGLVIAKGIDNKGTNEEVMQLIREKEKEIAEKYNTETLSQEPKINSWRQAYSSFGAKPKKNKCSVESLYRMILEGIALRHINKVVDIYNFVSIKHMIPVGGDNTDAVDGDIILKVAKGDEPFTELNSDKTKNPKEGEVVYADDKEILCRRWNWRECNKTKMTEETKNVCLVVEGLQPITKEEVETIIKELAELVTKFCGGEARTKILNDKNKEIDV